jgi:hypothetical protein
VSELYDKQVVRLQAFLADFDSVEQPRSKHRVDRVERVNAGDVNQEVIESFSSIIRQTLDSLWPTYLSAGDLIAEGKSQGVVRTRSIYTLLGQMRKNGEVESKRENGQAVYRWIKHEKEEQQPENRDSGGVHIS